VTGLKKRWTDLRERALEYLLDERGLLDAALSRSFPQLLSAVCLRGAGTLDLGVHPRLTSNAATGRWTCVLTSEDAPFAPDPVPPVVYWSGVAPTIHFRRPSAVILKAGAAVGDEAETAGVRTKEAGNEKSR
jgi:hypothetical protein